MKKYLPIILKIPKINPRHASDFAKATPDKKAVTSSDMVKTPTKLPNQDGRDAQDTGKMPVLLYSYRQLATSDPLHQTPCSPLLMYFANELAPMTSAIPTTDLNSPAAVPIE